MNVHTKSQKRKHPTKKKDSGSNLLFTGAEWSWPALERTYEALETIAHQDLGLVTFRNQLEVISSDQMLDAYSSTGLPLMYRHWSFGKNYARHERLYRKGAQGLAYELVINSNPCISYSMEDNTMALMILVMAHAAFGHNHFFRNNHLFQEWTDPDGIVDFLQYARDRIQHFEERYGREAVENTLDAAHALMPTGVDRRRRKQEPTLKMLRERDRARLVESERRTDYLLDFFQTPKPLQTDTADEAEEGRQRPQFPEENVLFFIEQHSPALKPWQRETLRIVRTLAQYFYPQRQTQVMNEGCACFVHYYMLHELHRKGQIDDGTMLEVLHHHTNVIFQPDYDDRRYGGINPYAIGFAMMQDIRRIATGVDDFGRPCSPEQLAEDQEWFPEIAGVGDWRGVLKDAWANYRDESFIQQYLSPKVMRDFRMFSAVDRSEEPFVTVTGIHDEHGYLDVRTAFARTRDISITTPDIQVVDADLLGDRELQLRYFQGEDGIPLDQTHRELTLMHLRTLWGHKVTLKDVPSGV